MRTIAHQTLRHLTERMFWKAGCHYEEAERVARHLVDANLAGHDSHGVIRVPMYLDWLRAGKVLANQRPAVVFETETLTVVDGRFGFGQTAGEFAMRVGIDKVGRQGVAVVALRDAGHLGRIGDWPLMATEANKISLHFVSTSGHGLLVAPHGGIDRRLSANPIAVGIPVKGARPIILDISTCAIAEGKIRVALNRGELIPDGCVIDREGQPTNDPNVFYADPGAILPIAGHKGYGLSVVTEILAEAFTGNGCSDTHAERLCNGMLTILLDPARLPAERPFDAEVQRFIAFVKSARPARPGGEVLMPGEVEDRARAERLRDGIPLEDTTRAQLLSAARTLGIDDSEAVAALAVDAGS